MTSAPTRAPTALAALARSPRCSPVATAASIAKYQPTVWYTTTPSHSHMPVTNRSGGAITCRIGQPARATTGMTTTASRSATDTASRVTRTTAASSPAPRASATRRVVTVDRPESMAASTAMSPVMVAHSP